MRKFALFVAFCLSTGGKIASAEPTPSETAHLIKKLGSESFAERANAASKLEAIGEPALPVLFRHLTTNDPEVCARLKAIIDTIRTKADKEARQGIEANGGVISDAVSGDGFPYSAVAFSEKKVSPQGLAALRRVRNLQVLDLSKSIILDDGFKHLKGLDALRKLNLEKTNISDESLSCCSELTDLEELSLRGTKITDRGLAHLRYLGRLRCLDLSETSVRGSGLANLKNARQLEALLLCKSGFDETTLTALRNLEALESLNLADTKLTDKGVEALPARLRYLNLSGTKVKMAGESVMMRFPRIKLLMIHGESFRPPAREPVLQDDKR